MTDVFVRLLARGLRYLNVEPARHALPAVPAAGTLAPVDIHLRSERVSNYEDPGTLLVSAVIAAERPAGRSAHRLRPGGRQKCEPTGDRHGHRALRTGDLRWHLHHRQVRHS